MKNKRLIIIMSSAALLLTVPFWAMQFTSEVNWSPFDFLLMGFLLFVTGLSCEFVLRKAKDIRKRILICGLILLLFLLVWAELAVGLFGSPFAGS